MSSQDHKINITVACEKHPEVTLRSVIWHTIDQPEHDFKMSVRNCHKCVKELGDKLGKSMNRGFDGRFGG